jgi:hypothetical protein
MWYLITICDVMNEMWDVKVAIGSWRVVTQAMFHIICV